MKCNLNYFIFLIFPILKHVCVFRSHQRYFNKFSVPASVVSTEHTASVVYFGATEMPQQLSETHARDTVHIMRRSMIYAENMYKLYPSRERTKRFKKKSFMVNRSLQCRNPFQASQNIYNER